MTFWAKLEQEHKGMREYLNRRQLVLPQVLAADD